MNGRLLPLLVSSGGHGKAQGSASGPCWQRCEPWGWTVRVCVCVRERQTHTQLEGEMSVADVQADVQIGEDHEGHTRHLLERHLLFRAGDRVRITFCQDCPGSCGSLISSCYYFIHNKVDSEFWISIQTPKNPSLPSDLGRNVA